jgi:predicted transposase YdaD
MSEMEAIDAAIAKSKTDTYFGLFLAQHEREVKNMCLTEFDQDKYDEMIRRESREEGIELGRAQGLERGLEQGVKRTKLIFRMERDGKTISEIAKVAGISEQEVKEILED